MADSIPEERYAKYTASDTGEFLSSLPTATEKTFEDNFLDFKSGKAAAGDMKKVWSKVIGAMANAGGGVVVWGLDARKDPATRVDAVCADEPLHDVEAFYTRLTEAERDATDPLLSGIRKKMIRKSKGSKDGYIVCLIPQGSNKPYESRHAPKQYHLRVGDSSPPMPRTILQQLFNPSLSSEARLIVSNKWESINTKNLMRFDLDLQNIGKTSIENPAVKIVGANVSFQHLSGLVTWSPMPEFVEIPKLLHPGMCHKFSIAAILSPALRGDVQLEMNVSLFQRHHVEKLVELRFTYKDQSYESNGAVSRAPAEFTFSERSPRYK
jgi:Putative DNA-binding domain